MTYFVTGATGFIGKHLIERLLARPDATVQVLVRASSEDKFSALQERYATTVQRTRRLLRSGGAVIELALDEGTVQAGGRSLPALRMAGSSALRLEHPSRPIARQQTKKGRSARPSCFRGLCCVWITSGSDTPTIGPACAWPGWA